MTLGKIIAADIVLNNPNRMPATWSTSGNITNLFVEVDMDVPNIVGKDELLTDPTNLKEINVLNLCAIDSVAHPIDTRTNRGGVNQYLDLVENFLNNMFDDINKFRSSMSYQVPEGENAEGIAPHQQTRNIKHLPEIHFKCTADVLRYLRFETKNDELFSPGEG